MAANMDAMLRIKSEISGDAAVRAALQGMQKLTQQLADTQAKSAAANNQAIQQSIALNQKLAQATTAAGIDINNAEKQILGSKLQQAKTDKDRQAIQDQLASLEIKNGRLRRQGIEDQLNAEVQLAVKKRDAIQLELKRAQAAVATAGKYGQITPEIVRQAEAARRNLDLANQEVRVTSQIAAEKRKVADAQLKATENQAQMSRAVDTTKNKMSQLREVVAGLGIADLARRMGDFAKSTLEAGEQSGLIGTRIKNLAGQFNETAAVTKLAADSAKRYGLSSIEASEGVADLYGRLRPLGVGLADIQLTFTGVNNAAKQAGLSTYDAKEAFLQLGQAMGSGKLQGDELRSLMERMPAIGRAIVDVFNDIARSNGSAKVTLGDLKELGAHGAITTDIVVSAMKKLEQIQPPPPTAMQQFTAAMADLRMELGEVLLPLLTPAIQLLTGLIRAFGGLPEPVKAVAGGLLALVGALGALALPLAGFAGVIQLLAGTGAWTAITGGLGAIAAFLISWPVLLVAAGVAIFLFRDQIYGVVDGINKSIQNTFNEIIKTIYGAVDTINKTIQAGIRAVWDWASNALGNVAKSLAAPFEAAAGAIKGVLRSVLQFGAQVINGFLGAVNQMINAVNSVAARLRLPQLPTFGTVSVPSFAGGGYTGNAPRSGGLDGRGGFMAMLHPRETVIDHTQQGGGPTITIQTGQVVQMPDGSQWVSMADLEQAMRATAAGVLGQLRTPAGRVAMGGA